MQTLADANAVADAIERLSSWVGAHADGSPAAALIGIKSRGEKLSRRIAGKLGEDRFDGRIGSIDITLYRDDLSEREDQPRVRTTDVPFNLDGLDVCLIDDVLMTGRTVRAALQAIADLGRPRRLWLGVLADRGGRELPIQADCAALDLRGLPDDQHVRLELHDDARQDRLLALPRPQRAPA
ncbi:MAG: bifunctional pyr operon transcriptional regulator/uracil phosphoribosyltransferase PyrR [Planctomycetota bacterium]